MMKMNSRPTPSFAWIDRSWIAVMIPSSADVVDVIMNSRIFVRATGTPMLRAATASPPTAKIQLPKRVRASSRRPSTVSAIHQMHLDLEVVRRPHRRGEEAARAESNPGALSMPLILTAPVSFSVPPAFTPCRMKNVPRVTMKLGSLVLTTV